MFVVNVWHIEITQMFMKYMNELTSHRNNCLSDKFGRRFIDMLCTHTTHLLTFLSLYHLKFRQNKNDKPNTQEKQLRGGDRSLRWRKST